MADYTTIAKVEALLPKGAVIDDGSSDKPARADVVVMISDLTKQIDAAVTRGGGTPQLTGDAAGEADLLSKREAVYQILTIRGVEYDKDKTPEWVKWHTEFEAYIDRLGGVVEGGGTSVVLGAPRRGADVDPWFTRDMKL